MEYTIRAIPTEYKGHMFRSRLEARWGAFFDLLQWDWEYEPFDLGDWSPDFRLSIPIYSDIIPPSQRYGWCSHGGREHHWDGKSYYVNPILVEIKPFYELEDFHDHPCWNYASGIEKVSVGIGAFGIDWIHSLVTVLYLWDSQKQMFLSNWLSMSANPNPKYLWGKAGAVVQWKAKHDDKH